MNRTSPPIVRAIDVGYGQTKYVRAAQAGEIRCDSFPSLAYPQPRDPSSSLGADRRDTVAIPIGGMFYEVGPDVVLASDGFRAHQVHDDYIRTPEYMALARGAMRLMQVDVIDLLVVGLPVAHLRTRKDELAKLMTGVHDLGSGRSVLVQKTLVVAQPQGALFDRIATKGNELLNEAQWHVVVDPGSRTFDWLVIRGKKLSAKRSHSVNRGVLDILQLIAEDVSAEIGRPYQSIEAIDLALRNGSSLVIGKRTYGLGRMRAIADSVAQQAVGAMLRQLGGVDDVQSVLLAGGGAHMFKKALKDAFGVQRVVEPQEPMFANVRGFQQVGMAYADAAAEGAEA